ncbi:lambda repressor-like predicted transcriptional regulator [Pseudomonas nitritireducens]|uniref:Lambda repressor-like predicted transcriptional regulator n=1 Tax=Pseudomonas nitroreducens TaxID=46680 RepID=A0A7W7KIX7_PSENT|nr:HipA family kinase [Pseudomonas nitritireducens]MBB4863326.1 lambda repressor-like predicted transcriptional regulator [Pseudomonas nitritireducens]
MKTKNNTIEAVLEAEVITFLGRESEGRDSETFKVELLDEKDKTEVGYVKLTADPRKVIAELAASQVGRALGMNIPRPYVALVDTAEIPEEFQSKFFNRGPMLCFASRQAGYMSYSLERAFKTPPDEHHSIIARQFNLNGTIVFDELVANTDRNLGNVIYAPDSKQVWLIDHGRALTGEYWEFWGLDDPGVSVTNDLAQGCSAWDEGRRRSLLATAQKVVASCATLCMDDLDKEGHYAKIDSTTDRQKIADFLKERIQHTVPLLCKRLQIAQLPF